MVHFWKETDKNRGSGSKGERRRGEWEEAPPEGVPRLNPEDETEPVSAMQEAGSHAGGRGDEEAPRAPAGRTGRGESEEGARPHSRVS